MAKIGLKNFRYGILTENSSGEATYGGSLTVGKAISCKVDVTNNESELYADDELAESDYGFQEAKVTLGIDEEDQTTMANILGHTVTEGEMVRNVNDVAPFVRIRKNYN